MLPVLGLKVHVPDLKLEIANEREVIDLMAREMTKRTLSRAQAGEGPDGALPRPKAGGHGPLRVSGQLLTSIHYDVRTSKSKSGTQVGVIYAEPSARYSIAEDKRRQKTARRTTKRLRAAAVLGSALQSLGGSGIRGNLRKKIGPGIKLGRIRSKAVLTNRDLMSVLGHPPKDLRARNGNRRVYRVLGVNRFDARVLSVIAQGKLRLRAKAVGGTAIET